jgi:hypothetical protein
MSFVVVTCIAGCGHDAGPSDDAGIASVSGTGTDSGDTGDSDAGSSSGAEGDADADSGDVGPETNIKFDLAPVGDAGPQGCETEDEGGIQFSYIYISNTVESTLSKLNTQTMIEEGRYITRPDQTGGPSRTSVNLSGDVAVANRAGGLTKVYARPSDCEESNGIPGIQTSTGKDDILPWGVEECVAWYTPFYAYNSQRPVAWTAGTYDKHTCSYVDQKLWSSGSDGEILEVVRLDGDTGDVEAIVPIPDLMLGLFGAYGGAVDGDDGFWFMTYVSGFPLVHVWEDLTYEVHYGPLEMHPYGITIDHAGRIWIGSDVGGVGRFDPETGVWDQLPGVTGLGIQEHPDGYMWMGSYPSMGIQAIDVETMALGPYLALPEAGGQTKGVSVDFYGYVWLVDMDHSAFRIDPDTLEYDIYDQLVQPYTYSDMTGWGLTNVRDPQG